MEIAQQLSLATCVHEAIWQHSDGNFFLSSLQKTELIHWYFSQPKKIQIPQQIYHIWYILFLVRPESLLKGASWRKKDRDKWRRNLFPFFRSSAVNSLHIYASFSNQEKKGMIPKTHEKVLGKQQKAKNKLFELRGIFWLGNSLNEFDKRS